MQMYTETRLMAAIHRHLSTRFFLRGWGICTEAKVCTNDHIISRGYNSLLHHQLFENAKYYY